jgi:hypothetical protein
VTRKHVELITAFPNTLLKASDEDSFINKEQHDYSFNHSGNFHENKKVLIIFKLQNN